MIKRSIDLALVGIGLLLVLPFFPLLGLLIKLDSRGPVFYRCARVGKDGMLFQMYKFRTMYETSQPVGASVSPEGDPRVTPFGRFLRRTKINELPQLLNILKGEMTFVGPRPEAPDLAALYPAHARAIFSVTPGLVGPNQILGRNEEEWYPQDVDPQQYYIEEILPKKLPLDLEYVRHPSLCKDLQYIVLGVKETVCKALSWKLVLQNRSQIYLLGVDFVLCIASFVWRMYCALRACLTRKGSVPFCICYRLWC
jgi:lipopolysaccharide/colanic/teichoic acid biosynthesis glycosyltransferase